ncbi:MAG: hypothetical protein KC766_16490 [Myxococcales bacterium]|nr:hypothetical protein [Myxococcales bacterium]
MMTNDDGTLTERGQSIAQRFAALVQKAVGGRAVRRGDLPSEAVAVLDAAGDLEPVLIDIMVDPALRRDMAAG